MPGGQEKEAHEHDGLDLNLDSTYCTAMATASFGARLRTFRQRARMTQRELADALDLDFTYVSKIESDRVPPPARGKIERAVEVLKLSPEEQIELFVSAERLPTDMEAWVTNRPEAHRIYRRMRNLPSEEQERLLDEFIERIERKYGPRAADEEA
jgi:transcriptional regulator with XRE-family HTH domain